jgi:hypothetical protein
MARIPIRPSVEIIECASKRLTVWEKCIPRG